MWTFGQETAILSSPPPHADKQGKKKQKQNQAAANILKMISFNLRSARFHLFLRNTKHKHWPLSRWSRTNISLDKHLEDKSWHEAPFWKKIINKSDAFSAASTHLSAEKLFSHEALPQKAAPDKHHQVLYFCPPQRRRFTHRAALPFRAH